MKVVFSDRHRLHDPQIEVEMGQVIPHQETPDRAERIRAALAADPMFLFEDARQFAVRHIEAVHDPGLISFLSRAWEELHRPDGPREVIPDAFMTAAVREGMGIPRVTASLAGQLGQWCFETVTPLVEGTYAAACSAVDVALTAAELVAGGERSVYGLCRPPGHHAPRSAYGGYCYFNNAAVAAHYLTVMLGARVTVLDVDYHHGNGTQQIFYQRGDVQYVSLHGDPDRAYPHFAGFAEETGAGRGAGTTLNMPLPVRLDDDGFLAALGRAIAVIDRFRPSCLIVSLGVDTYMEDPISDLALTQSGLERCGRAVSELSLPTLVLQEGGYHMPTIGENVRRWLVGLASS